MVLSCRFLIDVAGVNSFEISPQAEINAGDAQTLYIQLVDTSLDRAEQGYSPPGRRYMPPSGSTFQLTFANIDDAKKVTRSGTQPYPLDPSIWAIPIMASDPLRGTVFLRGSLVEPSRTLNFGNGSTGLVLRVK